MNKSMRIVKIDLENESVELMKRSDLDSYLGGTGLAAKLFSEYMEPELKPLHPDQPVIIANGPLNTIFPAVTKVVAVFRSPLTGGYGESHAGLRLGLALRGSGVDALILHGRAQKPVYLEIGPHGVRFKNAQALWGLDCEETGTILRRLSPGRGHRSCLRIGPAGEKNVAYANVNVDTYRHFGRMGLGAQWGSKNLKAIVVYGDENEVIEHPQAYRKVYENVYKKMVGTDLMEKYHDLGTAINIMPLHKTKALPTRNLQESSFEHAEKISGETFAKETLLRQIACSGCPIGCIHLGLYREQFGSSHEYKFQSLSYDHELIFALGSFLGMSSTQKVYRIIDAVEKLGLDAISTGVILGWAIEAYQKGILSEAQTGVELDFDDETASIQFIHNIIDEPNDFYKSLSQGLEEASKIYGGQDFAMTLGKHELAGYHTGHAHLFGMSFGARHSHLDNAGYAVDQNSPEQNPEQLVDALVQEEKDRNVLTSLCICLFARSIYDMKTVIEALSSIGIQRSEAELDNLGQEIFDLKNRIRYKLGYNLEDARYAERFFATPSLRGSLSRDKLEKMKIHYDQYWQKSLNELD